MHGLCDQLTRGSSPSYIYVTGMKTGLEMKQRHSELSV